MRNIMIKDRERLLAEADIYRLLSLCFAYPDRETRETIHSLAVEMGEAIGSLPFDIHREFLSFMDSLKGLPLGEMEGEYTELFMTRMLCSPYETAYGRGGLDKVRILSDIGGFYKAFGLSISDKDSDMPDHIAIEMEFLGLLSIKEAYGLEQGLKEMVDVCASAKRIFLEDHLGRWTAAFCRNLSERTTKDFYRSIALLTSRFIEGEVRFYDIDVRPVEELPRESIEPITCPQAGSG